MKKLLKSKYLPQVMLGLGALGLGLHMLLYILGRDVRGLLPACHPAELALWILTVLALSLAFAAGRRTTGKGDYRLNFPASVAGAAGCFVLAGCLVLTLLLQEPEMQGSIGRIWTVLGWASAACLVWAGFCRLREKPPFFACHLVICLFFAIHIVTHYQTWSSTPELMDYLFSMLGAMALLFFAYYRAAFDVDLGKRRRLLTMGLAALYLSVAALAETRFRLLYLGGVVWVMTNLPERVDE